MRLILGLIFSGSTLMYAQNLVPNSGFEEYLRCPNGFNTFGQTIQIPFWFSPNTGTPDYFNECSPLYSKAQFNWAGQCRDFSGRGYAGIITFMDKLDYREYLSVELLQPLDSGVIYVIQFSFRLALYSKISSGNIGLAFSSARINVNNAKVLSLKPVILAMPDSALVMETGTWQTASGEYSANGGERFIILGNFSDDIPFYRAESNRSIEPMLQNASFYYFDDVSVQRQVEFYPPLDVVEEQENLFEEDSLIVLRNVQFSYNSAELNEISKADLVRVLNFMSDNRNARIEIYGHTDDQGSDVYNRELSNRRARSVFEYLVENGIDPDRMHYFGFGKSMPLIDSSDEIARGFNRRVEVKLVK